MNQTMKTPQKNRFPATNILIALSVFILCLGMGCNSSRKSPPMTTSTDTGKPLQEKPCTDTEFITAQGKKEYFNLEIPEAAEGLSEEKNSLYYEAVMDMEDNGSDFIVSGWENEDTAVPEDISGLTPAPTGAGLKDMHSNDNNIPSHSSEVVHEKPSGGENP
ncbi:MAG: hypothetical protein ACLFQV_08720, partial [Vulcanimicrobiota bacterium]